MSTTTGYMDKRIGNFFAVATATSLKLAMVNACMQYIWLRLRQRSHRIDTVDAAFSMMGDLTPFFHADLYKRMYVGVLLAILIWAIPIASLFPPATLSVVLDLHSNTTTFDALQPTILKPQPLNQYGKDPDESFDTAYTDAPDTFATLVRSVAYAGRVTAPQALIAASNYSYKLDTYMPRFKCSTDLEDSHIRLLDAAQELIAFSFNTTFNKDTFAFVEPDMVAEGLTGDGLLFYLGVATLTGPSLDADDLSTMGLTESQVLIHTTDPPDDQRFIYHQLRDALTGTILFAILTAPGNVKFAKCALYNSSFETETSFANGIGTTNVLSITDHSEIRNFSGSVGTPTSYVHYFQEMTKLFVGAMSAADTVQAMDDPQDKVFRMPYSTIPIDSTVLGQAEDFSDMLKYRARWIGNGTKVTTPVQNKTFSTMVDELSVNVSLSLMSSPSLCRTVSVEGEIRDLYTIYHYQPRNLFVSYGVAIVCSLATIVVGFVAFCRNGESHDAKISTIGAMMQNPALAQLLRRAVLSEEREDNELARQIRLRLDTYTITERGGMGSGAYDEATGLRNRLFVGFVTDEEPDGFEG
ncbi:hypothetical protein H2200_006803 [Cladophialophora chaetospira]|uniref:Uncharacterized protein n=1 Tax=Cladophialophora chaetospira TaxID=386627 RepID=A0AA38X9H5_9EURO|nr:hypothetical protein H2200_006803 [Cladophialophora chaetospira]